MKLASIRLPRSEAYQDVTRGQKLLMTNPSDILKLIESGEGERMEFKTSFNIEAIETLVAFANTKGGKIVVGINRKNEIIGVKINVESV